MSCSFVAKNNDLVNVCLIFMIVSDRLTITIFAVVIIHIIALVTIISVIFVRSIHGTSTPILEVGINPNL